MSGECDIGDVLCQLETLRHLRGLQQEVGKEVFATRFPQLVGLGEKITEEIGNQTESLTEALRRCREIRSGDEGDEGDEEGGEEYSTEG